jgi:hypothetical protein
MTGYERGGGGERKLLCAKDTAKKALVLPFGSVRIGLESEAYRPHTRIVPAKKSKRKGENKGDKKSN